ncbi:biotin--[acetyl-CoA-carboxylase] ligase [Subtercola sp. Z020]|uniref:biotin--[acetyl-CoA-carboxylase] ligase n=1 Tax=Subtercola sp. Z020 TaxID=2080582 RepID=UPI000CE80ACA|nr:biotin--[acetyl-CoA-carboxylase] ligase [Subtercola sp. Z020]PPF82136.1 biotin--[acetyl-CoA-carboxylase] ligase [Subtercola sp. Z020]
MHAEKSRTLVPRLDWLAEAGSTNSVLVAHAGGPDAAGWPDLSVVVTDNQTAGRGRLGRVWSAPAGASLAISLLLRPALPSGAPLPVSSLGWIPLIGGAAMASAANTVLAGAATASVKWPNDVLIDGRKVSGVLSELLAGPNGAPAGVVVGAGVNLFLTAEQLPVATATSLALAGATGFGADDVLAAYLGAIIPLYRAFVAANGDAAASGVAAAVTALCGTLGQSVRVELPTGETVVGRASALDSDGRLVVTRDDGQGTLVVSAGDVTHLRY